MSQSELARRLGVSRQAVSLWCSNPNIDLSATNALQVAQELDVDPFWLVLGKGNMRAPKKLEEQELKMINVLTGLDETNKKLAIKLVSQLKDSA